MGRYSFFTRNKGVLLLASSILLLAIWYFLHFNLVIGSPNAATVRYYNDKQQQYETISLSDSQREQLVQALGKSTPSFFIRDYVGINNEDILITLFYADGSSSTYSLWSNRTILYSGDAEDISMAAMHGSFVHFCGSTDEELADFVNLLTSEHHQQSDHSIEAENKDY